VCLDPVVASAGDDGVVCIWVPSDSREHVFGDTPEQHAEDKESWRVKHMCRSSGSEIYDLVWSPDGIYILTGSMDNIARIYDSRDGILPNHPLSLQDNVYGILGNTVIMFREWRGIL
jgi:WD40 repeat protein